MNSAKAFGIFFPAIITYASVMGNAITFVIDCTMIFVTRFTYRAFHRILFITFSLRKVRFLQINAYLTVVFEKIS